MILLTACALAGIIQNVFRRSSMVEQEAVNFEVAGSSPAAGAKSIYVTTSPVSIHSTGLLLYSIHENSEY